MFSYDKKNASSGGQQFYQYQQNEDWFGDCNWPLSTVLLVQNECSGSIRNALCRKKSTDIGTNDSSVPKRNKLCSGLNN